ncbi:hypothetical protein HY407_04850 [Candidatus Gottesmanbacteria bacterium]|nr:hypothetical protein [Candidatus Gottesmanbacteria bacterium]
MKTSKDPRHLARLRIVGELFSHSFLDQNTDTRSHQVIEQLEKIDPLITASAPEFPLDKIAKVDLAILRLAIYELVIEKKEPPKVIIDEAVEIAKTLGGDGSPPFINGVLGTVLEHAKQSNL